MSAFFCDEKTINDAVRAMARDGEDKTALGRQLWTMNAAAVFERYSHIPEERENDTARHREIEAYTYAEGSDDPAQRRKSVACLLYQCSEGDVPGWELYQRLDALDDKLNATLPLDHPSVERASWGYF